MSVSSVCGIFYIITNLPWEINAACGLREGFCLMRRFFAVFLLKRFSPGVSFFDNM